MPELPDISLYIERLTDRAVGEPLERVRVASPFLVRTAVPPLAALHGKPVRGLRRIGKRIVFAFDDELFMVLHLMIAGRLRFRDAGAPVPGKVGLCAFDFPKGTLLFTEASSRKRASLHVLQGEEALAAVDPGGIDVYSSTSAEFRAALRHENHTLKRALTDPHILSGIGNAYSDEILHHARLSPVKQVAQLDDAELDRLQASCKSVLSSWLTRLRAELAPDAFPEHVTAFREGMAVHGRYGKPCPDCGAAVQRIAYAQNETNYCARCQTGGKLLADRSLSRLLKKDWPKTLEELEERREARSAAKAAKAVALPEPAKAALPAKPARSRKKPGA